MVGTSAASLSWTVEDRGGTRCVAFTGDMDENVLLEPLVGELQGGSVILDLAGVRNINSCGVREWISFVQALPRSVDVILARCSPAAVSQMNMIANFVGPARVVSFYAPYVCENCDLEEDKLLEVSGDFEVSEAPVFPCEKCGEDLEFDEFPETYFSFVETMRNDG